MPTQSAKIDYMTKALLSQEMSFQDCDIKRIVEERLKTHSIREIHTMIQKVVRNSILSNFYVQLIKIRTSSQKIMTSLVSLNPCNLSKLVRKN